MLHKEFENDVKTYSIQTSAAASRLKELFENDVKTYSIQTESKLKYPATSLRMM